MIINPYGINTYEIDEWYAENPAQFVEMACRKHEENWENVDHKVEKSYTWFVLSYVDKYFTRIVVKRENSIPMAEHYE